MEAFKESVRAFFRFTLVTLAVIFIINGAKAFVATIRPKSPPTGITILLPETPVPTLDPSKVSIDPILINVETFSVECGVNGEVVSAIMAMKISGGVAPYQLEFAPPALMNPTVEAGSTVQFTLDGGHTVTAIVKSNTRDENPSFSSEIQAPTQDERCGKQTSTPTHTDTPTATNTPTSTPAKHITFTSTSTKDKENEGSDPQTDTPTNTPAILHTSTPTNTPVVPPTKTPTNTPVAPPTKTPTNTPVAPPTKTPTNTPVVPPTRAPTDTPPVPPPPSTPTNTPVIASNLAECEDSRDNDGDGKIDMQDDQCKKNSDNHEDK